MEEMEVKNIAGTYFLAKLVKQYRGEEREESNNKRTQSEKQLPAQATVLLRFVDVMTSHSGGCLKHKLQ